MKKITIAIDGLSSCGKSTMAKWLAKSLGYIYVDTGAMYRSVTLYALRHGLFNNDGSVNTDALQAEMPHINISFHLNEDTKTPITFLNGENVETEIRTLEVSNHVSVIAAIGFVRNELVAQQQKMGMNKGVVMDGRDIASVVLPNADVKIFLTASVEERARRRVLDFERQGIANVDFEKVKEDIKERDWQDENRDIAPLVKVDSAILLDTTSMTIDEVVVKMTELVKSVESRN